MTQPCELPLVRYDVCDPETMKDVVHSLDSLRMIMDNMFHVLEKNVMSERCRLSNIHERLAICQSKVEAFKGSKRPTTVFSTAKFPGTDSFPLFDSIFQQSETSTVSR
jgi:WAHD domain of WASH complex